MRIPDMMMPHKVDLHPLAGVTAGGRTSKASIVNVRAFVEFDDELVRDDNGSEIVSSAKVTLDPENAIPLGSTITMWKGTPDERHAKIVKLSGRSNVALEYVSYRLE